MAYELTALTDAFKTSEETVAGLVATLASGIVVMFAGERKNDGWTKVKVLDRADVTDPVWMLLTDQNSKEVADPVPPPVLEDGFVRQCLIAERGVNNLAATKPWFIAADFIIARALFETNLKNRSSIVPKFDGVGPLQVTTMEWDRFLQGAGDFKKDFTAAHRLQPTTQIAGAAFQMFLDAKGFSEVKKSKPNEAGETAPLLPSYLDVFHTYLLSPKAAVAIGEAESDAAKKNTPIGELLDGLVDADLTADKIAAVFGRECFNGTRDAARKCDRTKSVAEFVAFTELWLKECLVKAFELIRTHAPDELPVVADGAKPGWYQFAESQLALGIKESAAGNTDADKPIIKYFDSTDFGPPKPTSSKTAWCGAFAAACMANSGNAGTIPKGAAAAENWKTWGVAVPVESLNIPLGAVVVLAPAPNTDSTGHVGFFDKRIGLGQVQLLGGNQSNAVARTPFPSSRVVAVRWAQGISPPANGELNLAATEIPQARWPMADLIVDRFKRAGFTKKVQLAAAVANAFLESGLVPTKKAGGDEESYGLFQCNMNGGLGVGFKIEELKNPEVNVGIIIKECLKLAAFKAATTVEESVRIFVSDIERPKDKPGAIAERTKLARKMLT